MVGSCFLPNLPRGGGGFLPRAVLGPEQIFAISISKFNSWTGCVFCFLWWRGLIAISPFSFLADCPMSRQTVQWNAGEWERCNEAHCSANAFPPSLCPHRSEGLPVSLVTPTWCPLPLPPPLALGCTMGWMCGMYRANCVLGTKRFWGERNAHCHGCAETLAIHTNHQN